MSARENRRRRSARSGIAAVLAATAGLAALPAAAAPACGAEGEGGPKADLRLQLSGLAASGSRDLDNDSGLAALYAATRLRGTCGPWAVHAEGRAATPRAGLSTSPQWQQAYVQGRFGMLSMRLGRQVVNWGRADRLNPTDHLSPRSLRVLQLGVGEDRLGADMATLELAPAPGWQASVHLVPRLRPNDLPRALTAGGTATAVRPAGDARSWAAKLDHTGSAIEGSLSVFDGLAAMPLLTLGATGLQAAQVRQRVVGGDLLLPLAGEFALRAEAADVRLTAPTRALAQAAGVGNHRWAVLGLERSFAGGWLANASLSLRRSDVPTLSPLTPASLPPALVQVNRNLWFQTGPEEYGLALAVARSPFEDDWSGEAGLVLNRSDGGVGRGVFALVEYRVDDTWSWRVSGQWFRGPDSTSLGSLRRNSVAVLEWRATFGR